MVQRAVCAGEAQSQNPPQNPATKPHIRGPLDPPNCVVNRHFCAETQK